MFEGFLRIDSNSGDYSHSMVQLAFRLIAKHLWSCFEHDGGCVVWF